MVAPNRDLANTYFPFDFSLLCNPQALCSNMAVDMDIDMPRGWSVNSSANSSRASSIHLNTSSIAYAERVQALNNNPTWADQVEISESQGPALSYATPKVGENNNANEAIATGRNLVVRKILMQIIACVNLKDCDSVFNQSTRGPSIVGRKFLPYFYLWGKQIFRRRCQEYCMFSLQDSCFYQAEKTHR